MIIQLANRRPKPEPPAPVGCSADWQLIDKLCTDLLLTERVEGQVRAMLGGLLIACLVAETAGFATAYWHAVKQLILAPLGAPNAGEPVYQPMIDKLRTIDELATEFWRNTGHPFSRYRPTLN